MCCLLLHLLSEKKLVFNSSPTGLKRLSLKQREAPGTRVVFLFESFRFVLVFYDLLSPERWETLQSPGLGLGLSFCGFEFGFSTPFSPS